MRDARCGMPRTHPTLGVRPCTCRAVALSWRDKMHAGTVTATGLTVTAQGLIVTVTATGLTVTAQGLTVTVTAPGLTVIAAGQQD